MMPGGERLGLAEARRASEAIRRARKERELTQGQLGAMLGVKANWVYARESGSRRLRRGDAEVVAAALGTDYAGLLEAGAA